MLDNKVCNCGGTYVNKKGKWVCDSCGRPMPQILDSRENQLLAVAEGKFAQEKFIEAEELYGDIVKSFPSCYPAYWGLTLAKHGIKYVDDLRTGKKVATCWAPEISSIQDDKNYKKVLEIAPTAERGYYEAQGEKIESIRKEWQEKAKKIKPYDVFICFKDTDDETKGRTEDSIELSDLYNNLTRDKYNVFFSRYSLEGITAENYEPYIFQALSTAKVMIVYGSKEEYFESTWMKNEWTRFLHKIADGQKQKNSLLPVVKGCSPSVLPPRLRSLQVLDAGKNTFYSDLTRYIDKVLATSEDTVELQRSKIKFDKREIISRGQARKIQSRALEVEDVEIISAQGEQLMKVINSFIQQKQFERAEKFCDAWIKSNPTNFRDLEELVQTILRSDQINMARKYVDYLVSNAPDRKKPKLWSMMLADGFTDVIDWADYIVDNHISLEYMQSLLPLISQSEISLLYAYYEGIGLIKIFDENVKEMILYVLEFDADVNKKNTFVNNLVKNAIEDTTDNFAYFDFVISLLDNRRYNSALASFVENYSNADNLKALQKVMPDGATYFLQALQKVLPLTEGNLYFKTHCAIISILFELGEFKVAVDETQKMLGFAEDDAKYSQLLGDTLEFALKNLNSDNITYADGEVFRMLGFLKDGDEDETYYFGQLVEICLNARYKQGAERYAKLLLGGDSEDKYNGYYYLMLLSLDCYNDDDVARLTVDVADTEGYNNWLANCNEEQISQVTNYPNEIDQLKVEQRKAEEKRIADRNAKKRENKIKSRNKSFSIILAILGVISLAFSLISTIKYFTAPIGGYGMLILMFLVLPTFFTLIGAGVFRFAKNNAISDKLSVKKRKIICCILIFPLLIANVLLYTLEIGRYKYIEDMYYVKDELNGTQTLYYVDISKRKEGEDVIIPSSVDKIASTAIGNKYPLEIFIPDTVKEIDAMTFEGCSKMTIYCVAESKPEGWDPTWNVYKDDAIWWSNNNLHYCTTYWGYKMQDEVDKDGNVIFKTTDGIDYKIVDGNAVVNKQSTEISGEITIPAQVTYNGKSYTVSGMVPSAFAGCNGLTGINVECATTNIPEKAFENCSNLVNVNFSSTVTSIGDRAFYGCKFTSFNTGVKSIGDEAFAACHNLTTFTVTGADAVIGNSAFAGCRALTTVSLGSAKSLGESAFENCMALTSVSLTGMESIGAKAFAGCAELRKFIIPANVTDMGDKVFFGCALIDVYCRAESKPDGWNIDWDNYDNSSRVTVTWNYKGN